MEFNIIYKAPRYKSAHISDPRYFNCLSYYLPPTESKRDAFVSFDQILKNPKIVNKQIARARMGKNIYSNNTLKLMAKFNSLGYNFKENTQSINKRVNNFNNNVKTSFKDKFMPEELNPYANRPYEVHFEDQRNPYAVPNSEKLKKFFDRASSLFEEVKDKLQNPSEETKPTLKQRFNSTKDNMSDLGDRIRTRLSHPEADNETSESSQMTFRQKLSAKKQDLEALGERLRLKLMYPEAREQYLQNKAQENEENIVNDIIDIQDDIDNNQNVVKEQPATSFSLKTFPGDFPTVNTISVNTENINTQNADVELQNNNTFNGNDISNTNTINATINAENANANIDNYAEKESENLIDANEDREIQEIEKDIQNEDLFDNTSSKRSVVQIISTKLTNASNNLKCHYINAKEYFSSDFKETKIYQYYDSFKSKCKRSIHSISSRLNTKVTENEIDYSQYGKKETRIRAVEPDLSK